MYQNKGLAFQFLVMLFSAILFVVGIVYKFMEGDFDMMEKDRRADCVVIYPDDYYFDNVSDDRVEKSNKLFYTLGGNKMNGDAFLSGKALFEGNCKQCHAVHSVVVGPALANILQRQKVKWLLEFIKYPEKMIKKKDKHALEMYEKYKQIMPNHDFLSDDQIIAILVYLERKN